MSAFREIVKLVLAVALSAATVVAAIAAAPSPAKTYDPDFFWLPPTVSTAALPTGPFDATALDKLLIKVCTLNKAGKCFDGPPLASFTSTTSPSHIELNSIGEYYTVDWLAGTGQVSYDPFYRVIVFKSGVELGAFDVDFVATTGDLASVDGARYIGVVRGQPLTIRFRIQQPTARTRVTINEVESTGGVPGDWAELYNSATIPISLVGYIVKDNDNTHSYVLPASAIIPPLGYFVVEESALGFGLGSADAVRFFAPDGTTLVDSYDWTAHAVTTYGRCPNGTGAFQTNTTATKGAANDCRVVIRINEIESDGGTPGDWVELYNPGPGPANLAGYILRDSDERHRFVLPGVVVPADGYLVLDEAAFGFDLESADAVQLRRPDGYLVDSYIWTAHAVTTYGRCPNGSGGFVTARTATKGTANTCFVPVTALHLNEVESSGGSPGDWVELVNTGTTPIDLSGWRFLDNDNTHLPYVVPAGSTIAPGGYFVLEEAAFGFGLGAADTARLFDPTGVLYESYSWTAHATTTYGRCPNGTGAFTTTTTVTKGAANDCSVPVTVHINEVESSGGSPGDWVELINVGANAADISGWKFLDNDDTHVAYVLPAGSIIAPGGYLVLEEAAFGFGLGAADSARLFDSTNTLVESFSWPAHAPTTYGRCPNGTGPFTTTTSVTKGAANDCGNPVKINEVESSGGSPGDWVEFYNPSTTAVDISGLIFRDSDNTHKYVIPPGTTIAATGYYTLEEDAFGFGLGAADSARLFDTTDSVELDSYAWAAHATTTYGRCPNGTGAFTTTISSTKGAANTCPGAPLPWPGDPNAQEIDGSNVFGGNLSGLMYESSGGASPGTLWGVRNSPSTLYRLIWDGTIFTPDLAGNWGAGKTLFYPGGGGVPDSEGITFTDGGSFAGIYVSTERDNNAGGVSRNSILRFDPSGTSLTLTATHEWNLTPDLPAVGPNLGMEAITWIPDAFLLPRGFFDETKGHIYNPGEYPNHGSGLFFVGLEANGMIYAYALDHATGGFARVATISSGLAGVMDLQFDRDLNDVWAVCDDTCMGNSVVLRLNSTTGKFAVARTFERPAQMPNLNNEGFAFAPLTECANNRRPAFWSDDSETNGHAIRRGTLTCTPF